MRTVSLLIASLLPALAGAELSQWEKNDIRKHYQEETFNRPATIRNKTVDQRYMEQLFPKSVTVDSPLYAPLPEIPSMQVFGNREIEFERFVTLLSKTIGYNSPIFLHIPMSISKTPIVVNADVHDLAELVDWLELRSGTRITVYPEAKTIQVTAEHDITATGSGN